MKLKNIFLASCLSVLALAGCSSASSADSTASTDSSAAQTETTSDTKAADTKSADTTDESKSGSYSDTANAGTSDTTASASKLDTITGDLKNKGYSVRKDDVDWDNGIVASNVKQEIECEGVSDFTIWEFDTAQNASASFDNIEKAEKLDTDSRVERSGSLLTITDTEDGDKEYYVLYDNLIVESDAYSALSDFQTWGLM